MDDRQVMLMNAAEQKGREYFRQGLNCSECVLRTFLDMHETGLPDEVIRLASGFGGGIGHTKNICGAITGAVLALGAVRGRDPFASEQMIERISQLNNEVYPAFRDMIHELEEEYGTLICSELCRPHGDFEGRARKKNCQQMIGQCCAIVEKYADASEEA